MPIEMTERLEQALEEWAGSRMKLGFEELGWQTKELIAAYREARDAAKTKPGLEAIARAALDYVMNDRLEDGDLTELDRLCQEYWDARAIAFQASSLEPIGLDAAMRRADESIAKADELIAKYEEQWESPTGLAMSKGCDPEIRGGAPSEEQGEASRGIPKLSGPGRRRNIFPEGRGEEVGFFHPNCKPDEYGLWSDCPKCAAERGWASITESHETPLTVERLVRVLRKLEATWAPNDWAAIADALEAEEE